MFLLRVFRFIRKHIKNNSGFYLILIASLIFGAIIGPILMGKLKVNDRNIILRLISPFFKNNNYNNFSKLSIFKSSLLSNLFNITIILLLGLINKGLILIPIVFIIKGFNLGFSVGYLVMDLGFKGLLISTFGIYIQNVFIVPSLIIIGAISMSLSYGSYNSMNKRRYVSRNINIEDYYLLILLLVLVLVFGSLIEGFISPLFLKYSFDII